MRAVEENRTPLLKNSWFWGVAILVLIIIAMGFIMVRYVTGNKVSTISSQTQQISPITPTAAPANTTSPSDTKKQDQYTNDEVLNSKIDQALASGLFVKATGIDDQIFKAGQGVLINHDLIVDLHVYRTEFDQYPYRSYLVVDFEIINISNNDYNSSLSNFMLRDMNKLNYTYSPVFGAHITGDIEGVIKYQDSKRGEIAFEIPIYGNPIAKPFYNLEFSTGSEAPRIISYSINLTNAPQSLGQ
jgi:hypothetical protein